MEKLRKDDFLYAFWRTDGFVAWLVNRQDELFLFMIKNMSRMQMTHMPYRGGDQVESISLVFQMLGMQEFPTFCNVNHLNREDREIIEADFKIYDEIAEQERKAHEEMLKKQQEEQEAAASAEDSNGKARPPEEVPKTDLEKPPLKVVEK